jgi:hypothetical protein
VEGQHEDDRKAEVKTTWRGGWYILVRMSMRRQGRRMEENNKYNKDIAFPEPNHQSCTDVLVPVIRLSTKGMHSMPRSMYFTKLIASKQ